jgi:hypothetical protein
MLMWSQERTGSSTAMVWITLGVFTIEEGDIDEEGILENLRELFEKDYIIRFPQHKKMESIVVGKASLSFT